MVKMKDGKIHYYSNTSKASTYYFQKYLLKLFSTLPKLGTQHKLFYSSFIMHGICLKLF